MVCAALRWHAYALGVRFYALGTVSADQMTYVYLVVHLASDGILTVKSPPCIYLGFLNLGLPVFGVGRWRRWRRWLRQLLLPPAWS